MTAANILGSMNKDGSRHIIHPADVKGRWTTARRIAFGVLIAIYVAGPLIPVGGHPMIQLDVEHRRFFLFGSTFNSQDFWMVLLLALSFAFGLLLVTAWRGRVWCGWACPQTVFLEGLYRPIERFFDGPRERRIRLASEPMSVGKFARRLGKYSVFFVISAAIAHTATALFVSPKELFAMITEGPRLHLEWGRFQLAAQLTAVLSLALLTPSGAPSNPQPPSTHLEAGAAVGVEARWALTPHLALFLGVSATLPIRGVRPTVGLEPAGQAQIEAAYPWLAATGGLSWMIR